jgi:16S rRNA (cytosine1402-N4)-methyltransferase
MDVRGAQTAADLINRLKEDDLRHILQEYGEERWSGRIARRIIHVRRIQPIRTSGELARVVCEAVPRGGRSRIHPATRVFMALRIAVNDELNRLAQLLDQVPEMLNPGGRLCVLSFHSLEDRIVKQRLKAMERRTRRDPWLQNADRSEGSLKILTRKVVRPGSDEIAANPMARSTKLRAAERS